VASLRGWLFDHIGLKLVSLLLAVLVYLYVYTEREARLTLAFPVQVTGLADTLALAGRVPAAVEAEVSGSGRQLLRLKFFPPSLVVDFTGVGPGRVTRRIGVAELPLPSANPPRVQRMLGPEAMTFRVEPRLERRLPVRAAVAGQPARGHAWSGVVLSEPESVLVSGPRSEVLALAAVDLGAVRLEGRRDTVVSEQAPRSLGPAFRVEPARVRIRVPIEPAVTQRLRAPVRVRGRTGWKAEPESVTVEITAARGFWQRAEIRAPVGWVTPSDTAPGGLVEVQVAQDWRRIGPVRVTPERVKLRRE
jgi:hypothetical protein